MKILKNIGGFLAAPVLALVLFIVLFQMWRVDLSQPIFSYEYDSLFSAFEAKIVIDEGWFFGSEKVGLPHFKEKFYLHDFPLEGDSFHFFILKVLSHFTSNPFLAVNLFFLISFILISATSFVVLRSFGISIFTAIIISTLYSFAPYHFYRNIFHNFLSNYMVIPLSVMVALWIASDKIKLIGLNKKSQFHLEPNRFFFVSCLVVLFAAVNGIYYAVYSYLLFIFAWFLRGLKHGQFFNRVAVPSLFFVVLGAVVLFALYLPSISYWMSSGPNSLVGNREAGESQFFSLRIVNLFLPVANHYLDYFQNIRSLFNEAIYERESASASLGILASSGFLFLLLWFVARVQGGEKSVFNKTLRAFSLGKNEQNLISNLSGLNLLVVLFATAGGLVMLVAMPFPLIRSHARFSIFIAFISLFVVAIIFDKILQKKKLWMHFALSVVFILALLDQVGRVSAETIQSKEIKDKFISDSNFIHGIESRLPVGAKIFQMPLVKFPEAPSYDLMIGYLNSDNLRWSYPAMYNRSSYNWQKEIIDLSFEDFIYQLRSVGFSAIYIDRMQMVEEYGWEGLRDFEFWLRSISEEPPLVSKNLRLALFRI